MSNSMDNPMDQVPLSMEFSRQEYGSKLPFPSPGDLPDPGIKHWSPTLQADALSSEPSKILIIPDIYDSFFFFPKKIYTAYLLAARFSHAI